MLFHLPDEIFFFKVPSLEQEGNHSMQAKNSEGIIPQEPSIHHSPSFFFFPSTTLSILTQLCGLYSPKQRNCSGLFIPFELFFSTFKKALYSSRKTMANKYIPSNNNALPLRCINTNLFNAGDSFLHYLLNRPSFTERYSLRTNCGFLLTEVSI